MPGISFIIKRLFLLSFLVIANTTLRINAETSSDPLFSLSACGESKKGYKELSLKSITKNYNRMIGQNVMIKSTLKYPEEASCTKKKEYSNLSINNKKSGLCYDHCWVSSVKFSDSDIVVSGTNIGCNGTNCNWKDKCAYSNNDIVVVYGKIEHRNFVKAHTHCLLQESSNNSSITSST